MANQQNGAFYGSVEEYVKARGGNRPIKKVGHIVCGTAVYERNQFAELAVLSHTLFVSSSFM